MSEPDQTRVDGRSGGGTSEPRAVVDLPNLHVLVCDDDASTRFAVKRLLSRQLTCTIGECSNGLEALRALAERHVDLLLLDVEMPSLDGVETLAEIRASSELRTLPVVILSNERHSDTVMKLIEFGVDGYLLKPIRGGLLRENLDRLRPTLAARQRAAAGLAAPAGSSVGQPPSRPAALLVDGDVGFRAAFARESHLPGPIMVAGSATEALARFRQTPAPLAFVGGGIGILSPGTLVQRLRILARDTPLTIVGIGYAPTPKASHGFDAVIDRTVDPDRLRLELGRVTGLSGSLGGTPPREPIKPAPAPPFDLLAFSTRVAGALAEGGKQTFKLLLDADLQECWAIDEPGTVAGAYVDLTLQNGCLVTLGVEAGPASSRSIAARTLGKETTEVTEDDARSAAQEIARQLGGHTLRGLEGGVDSNDCSEPRLEPEEAGRQGRPAARQRSLSYRIPVIGASVTVRLDVFGPLAAASAA